MTLKSLPSSSTFHLVATLSTAYMLSQFLRASVTVIAPELRNALSLSPNDLGLISGIFFTVFALAQIPLGIVLDRYGPRRVLGVLSFFTVAGCLIFAMAETAYSLTLGRAIMGLGCSGMLMGPYVIYARRFPAHRFAALASIQGGIGTMGALLATAPLAVASAAFGWRAVFLGGAVMALVFAVATLRVTRDAAGPVRHSHNLAEDVRGVLAVLRLPGFLAILPLLFLSYAGVAALSTLWAGMYLTDVHGLGQNGRGLALFIMMGSNIAGSFSYGAFDRWMNSRRRLITIACGGNAGFLLLLGLMELSGLTLSLAVTLLILALIGYFGGNVVGLFAHSRALLPDHLVGRGVTVANTANMLGVAAVQSLMGAIADLMSADSVLSAGTYGVMFAVLGALLLGAVLIYQRVPDYRFYPPERA